MHITVKYAQIGRRVDADKPKYFACPPRLRNHARSANHDSGPPAVTVFAEISRHKWLRFAKYLSGVLGCWIVENCVRLCANEQGRVTGRQSRENGRRIVFDKVSADSSNSAAAGTL
jgi:hypothetical protein